jgi:hypothetical protein
VNLTLSSLLVLSTLVISWLLVFNKTSCVIYHSIPVSQSSHFCKAKLLSLQCYSDMISKNILSIITRFCIFLWCLILFLLSSAIEKLKQLCIIAVKTQIDFLGNFYRILYFLVILRFEFRASCLLVCQPLQSSYNPNFTWFCIPFLPTLKPNWEKLWQNVSILKRIS